MIAVKNGHHDAVDYFLSLNADVNVTDNKGNTALYYGAQRVESNIWMVERSR